MKIVITGCLGFIGKHLVHELQKNENLEILCLVRDNDDVAHLQTINADFQKCDLLNKNSIEGFIQESDLIIHLAAKLRLKNDEEKFRNNVESTDPERVLGGDIDFFLEAALYQTEENKK